MILTIFTTIRYTTSRVISYISMASLQRKHHSRPEPKHPTPSAVPPRNRRAAHWTSATPQTTHQESEQRRGANLATFGSRLYVMAPLCNVVLTAVKRQAPQHIWPQGAMVAFVGGLKQIGQVYSASSSGARGGGGTGVSVGVGVGVRWWWWVLKEEEADTVVDGMVSKSGKGDGESVVESELVEPNLTRTISSSSSSLSCASRFGLRSL